MRKKGLSRRNRDGFGVAPILYMLGLIGVGAGVLFSGYSQSLKNNIQLTNSVSVKSDLDSAATTMAATSVLSGDGTVLCPPQGGAAGSNCVSGYDDNAQFSTNQDKKLIDFYQTGIGAVGTLASDPHMPSGYATSYAAGSPVEVGVFASGSGFKQLDPWGHYYIVCRWENTAQSGSNAFQVISAGADGILQTSCNETGSSPAVGHDDQVVSMDAANAINRAAVWQAGTIGTTGVAQVQFGTSGVSADAQGNLIVPNNLKIGSAGIAGSGNITLDDNGTLTGNLAGGTVSGTTASFSSAIAGQSYITADSYITSGSYISATGGLMAEGSTFNVTAGGAVSAAGGAFAVDSSGDLTSTGNVTIGSSNFVVTGSTGDTNILGIVTIGSATSTVPSNPALVANGAVNIGTQIKSGTATALLSVGTSTGSGPSKTYMFSVDQYGDIYSGGSSSVINGSLGGSFNGAVTASSLTATSLTSITGAIGAWSTTGNITTVGTITATNFSGNFTGTVNLGGGSGGATVSGVLPLANGGTGYAASSNIDLMNEMGITSSGYLNTALLTGNLIPGADLVNNSVTSMQLNNITSPGTYNSVVVGSDGRITSGTYTPIGTNQLNDGSGDTITAGTTGLLFDLGSTQEGIWTTTGLGIGTTAPGAALDVNGNVRIENAGEPAGTTLPNQLQLMSGAASERWSFTTDGSTESSGNNGSNFVLNSYTNAGALLATPLIINRATSAATFAGTVAATEFIGSGSGLTNIGTGAIVGTVGPGNGGTGTSTVFTPGSVVFAGTSGIYAQNNANFFWDNTNERLGIGTATPGQPLDIVGNARLSGNVQFGTGQQLIPVSSTRMAVQPISGNNESDFVIEPSGSNTNSYLYLAGNNSFGASTSYGFVTMNGANMSVGNFAPAGSLTFETNNTAQMTIGSTGKIGIGTAVANSLLQIYQGEVQVGSSGTGCSSANAGAIRYSAATIYYCDGVSTWQTVYGSGGSVGAGVNLGTSAATTNPQRSGQPGTGLYSANSGEVDVAGSGVQIAAFTSGGINIATGGLNIGGVNGVSFPLDYITDASIAIGSGALASQVAAGATQGNTAIGYQTLGSTGLTTAATGNTGVGYQALAANTSGNNNTALGGTALPANTTGTYNTATGASALHYNTTGFSNTANGALALNLNTTGNSDTAVGYAALPTTTASGDTGVGYDVGYNVTGTNNSLFGASVGGNLTSGSGNILVGIGGATTAGGADVPSNSTNNFLNIGNTLEGNMANANAVGRETLYLNSVAGSVNYVQMSGGATGTGPTLAATGTDTNVNLTISPQGTGAVLIPAGSIGIGTGTPNSLVQAYSGEVQVGSSGNSCTALRAGALRYAGGSAYVCDGTNWDIIGGSAGGTLPSLTNGDIWVGNASNVATAVALTQDVTITNAGVATVGKIQNVAVGVPTGTAGTAVVLAGSPTLTGTVQAANITMSGEEALTLAADYTTTGSQADVVLATASAVRYNGSAAATFTGIVAGTSGQILYLHNASASTLTLSDQSDSTDGTAANKIITGTGTDLKVPTNTSVTLQYDGMGNRWRVTGSSNSANTLAAGSTGQVQFNGGANLAANANFFWDNTNFRLGIGTSTAPVNKLDIYGGVAIGTSYAGVSTAPTNGMIVLGSTGIGTASPGYLLHVYNPGQASTGVPVDGMAVEIGSPTSGTRAGYGPSIIFKDAGISVNSMARIAAIYETVGPVSAGALSFYTNPASPNALVERMRISNAGLVGIGSTTPLVSLDLSQKSDAIALPVGTDGNRPTGTNLASGEIRYNTATPAAVEYYNGTTWVPLDSSGSSIGSGIVLGTSVTVPNPYGSATDTTTGLYTSGPGHVDVTSAGTQVVDISASGINITTGSLKIAGVNGLSFPPDYTTDGSIAIGSGALAYQLAGTATPGTQGNTVIGYQAISSSGLTAAAVNNTAVGYQTLKANTSGNNNTAGGYQALQANTSGGGNTAYGELALENNQNGGNNTAIGLEALASNLSGGNNTAVGYYALINSTGGSNAAFGSNALQDNTGGASNTALGDAALYTNVSGNNNTAVGAAVGYGTLSSGSFNILIGVGTVGVAGGADTPASSTSNYLNIGNTIEGSMANASAVNRETLYLNSVASSVNYVKLSGGATGTGPTLAAAGTDTNVNLTISPQGTGNTLIPTGSVGIGLASPAVALDVSGTIRAGSFGSYLMPNGGSPNNYNQGMGINAYWNGSNWQLNTDSANNGGALMLSNEGAGDLRFYTIASAAAGVATGSQTIGSSTIGNYQRMIIQSNGNVGIGSAAPGAMLDVGGGINNTGNATLSSLNYSSTGPTVQVGDSQYGLSAAGGNLFLWTSSGGSYIFDIGTSTQAMVLTSSGKLGIGSTTPVVSLDLSQKSDAIALPVGTNGNRPTGTNLASGEIRYNTATPAAVEYYNGTTWVPLDSSGSSIGSGLVLGTSLTALNPTRSGDTTTGLYSANAGEVDVAGSGVQTAAITGTGITINGQVAQTLGLFRETTAAATGNSLTLQAGGAVSVGTNLNGGNLVLASGIATGTGSSNIQFTTYPAGSIGTADNTALTAATLSATGTLAAGTVNTTIQGATGIGTNINGGNLTLASGISTGTGTSSINLNIYKTGTSGNTANSATTAMTIGTNGYVGIGTTSPVSLLQLLQTANTTAGGITVANSSQTGSVRMWADTSGNARISGASSEGVQIDLNAGGAGNVGIGTINPQNKLDVYGAVAVGTSYAGVSTAPSNGMIVVGSVGIGTTSPASTLSVNGGMAIGTTYAATNAAGSNDLIVQSAIGIGTTAPTSYLTIGTNGNAASPRTSIELLDTGYATPTADGTYSTGDKYIQWNGAAGGFNIKNAIGNDAYGLYIQSSGYTSAHFTVWTGPTHGTAPLERLRIDSSGNLGIGTSTMTSLLQTYDAAAKTATYTGVLHSVLDTSSTASVNKVGMDVESTGTWNGTGAVNTGLVVNATGGTTNYAATFSGGNVGIGTAAPAAPLHVNGTSLIVGSSSTAIGALFYNGAATQPGCTVPTLGNDYCNDAFIGVYDPTNSTYYGISAQLPAPSGVAALGGYYNGLAVGATTNNMGNPIFGALTSTQYGNGVGYTALTIYDTNKITTYHNVLDDGSGKVGIGTTAPAAVLDIEGAGNVDLNPNGNVVVGMTGAGSYKLHVNGDIAGNVIHAGYGSSTAGFSTDSSKDMTFTPDGTERVRFKTGGNVGIGSTTPVVSLDLSQKSDAIALPVGTNSGRPTGLNLVSGEIRYNTATPAAVEYYNGTTWVPLDSSGTSIGSGIVLGTSLTALNPTRNGDTTTGLYSANAGEVDVAGSGVQTTAFTGTGITINGQAAQTFGLFRETTASTAGNSLTVQAGGAVSVGTNLNGGNLILASGIATGTGSSNIQFNTYNAGSTGTTDDAAFTALTLSATGATGTTANTTLQANAGSGTNQNGGTLTLASGVSTGTGTSSINFNIYKTGSTGATANSATTAMTIGTNGYVGIGTTSPHSTLDVAGNVSLETNVLKWGASGSEDSGLSRLATATLALGNGALGDYSGTLVLGKVGIGSTTPNVSLDLSAETDAIALPVGTNGTRPASLYNGEIRYNTATPAVEYYNGASWVSLLGSGSSYTGGTVTVPYGGTGDVTLTVHGLLVGEGTANVNITAAGTAGQILTSGGASADPAWTTATYPVTTTANQLVYSSATNTVTGLATANNGVLVTGTTGVPSIGTSLPNAVQTNITSTGTITTGIWNGTGITVPYGGTGDATLTPYGVLLGNGTGAINTTAVGPTGTVLIGNTGANPTFSASPSLTSLTLSANAIVLGSIGIGTVSPLRPLDVAGVSTGTTVTTASAASLGIMNTDTTNGNFADMAFQTVDTSAATSLGAKISAVFNSHAPGAVSADMAFLIKNTGTTSEKMRITAGGNVGIGSTTPVVSLDLSQKSDAIALPVGTNSGRPTGLNLVSGEIRYNTATPAAVEYYNGTTWVPLDSSGTSIGSGIVLGTSLTALNPTRNGDTTTGLYSANAGEVDVAGSGVQTTAFTGTGITINGQAAQTFGLFRETTASTAGNSLTVQAGGAVSVGTNLNGGNLILASGIATGTGSSNIQFNTYNAGSTGTTDDAAFTALTLSATGATGTTANTTLQANAGSGTNQNGGTLTLASGVSTGTGTSSINFNIYKTGSTGATANSATTAMTIGTNGYVGIGTTSPSYPLVVGTSSSNGNGAYLSTAGVWTNMSDRRLKENVRPIGYGLDAVMKLRPVAYDMIGSHDEQVGFIAQDVLKILPEVVGVPKNPETEHYGLSYGNMVAVTVKALQELKALFDKDHGLLVKLHHLFDADHAIIEKLKAANDNQAKSIDELRDMMLKQQQDFDEYKKAHP